MSVASCAGTYSNEGWVQSAIDPEEQLLIEPGPSDYSRKQGKMKSEYGCIVSYRTFQPANSKTSTTLILAHGFERKIENMAGWGEHFASHGVTTVIPEFCNSSLLQILTHCHFENPYDARCELVCGKVVPEGFALELQNTIRAQATRWVLQHAELRTTDTRIFNPGVTILSD
jgi:hypothetical protein